MITRRTFVATSTAAAVLPTTGLAEETPLFKVGLIADAQYVDGEPKGIRHYRNSVQKLGEAVASLNEAEVDFSIHLGDLIDREFASFDAILEPLGGLDSPVHQILGNHDYSVDDAEKAQVPAKMGLTDLYYAFSKQGLRFIFLDGTEISTFTHPKDSSAHKEASERLAEFQSQGRKSAKSWNAAIGPEQLAWLDAQLKEATAAGEKAIVSCHYPILPDNSHNLWNDQEVLAVIDQHAETVIAWFNGHNHVGNYAERNGVHYVTVQGMVDTAETNAFGVIEVFPNALNLRGSGRVSDRVLTF